MNAYFIKPAITGSFGKLSLPFQFDTFVYRMVYIILKQKTVAMNVKRLKFS